MTYMSSVPLQTKLRELISETKPLVLDLAGMKYLDSFGLGVVASVFLAAKRRNCRLKLINTSI